VHSEVDKGTVFRVYLRGPQQASCAPSSHSLADRVAAGASSGAVLLVEDNAQVREAGVIASLTARATRSLVAQEGKRASDCSDYKKSYPLPAD